MISEIKACLENECYLAALITTLTLPDICGKAEYSNLGNGKRYIEWYEKFIGEYLYDEENEKNNIPYLSGKIIYSLRNALLHQGDPNIDLQKCELTKFNLVKSNLMFDIKCSVVNIMKNIEGENKKCIRKDIIVNINILCRHICRAAKKYYGENKEKFDFINYNILDWNIKIK